MAIAAGSFFERKNQNGFTWIRGFHAIEAHAVANTAFYYGPVPRDPYYTVVELAVAWLISSTLLCRRLAQ